MGANKEIVREYASIGVELRAARQTAGIAKNHYYHRRKTDRKVGRPMSTCTTKYIDDETTEIVPNLQVVEEMEGVFSDPDTQYGYLRMTALKLLGYIIGKDKVCHLMKEHGLLQRSIRPSGKNRIKAESTRSSNAHTIDGY